MLEILVSQHFEIWLTGLKDRAGRARILDRIDRLAAGNFGDTRSVGAGISEIRMHFGPGYRVYFKRDGAAIVILLIGGDKGSQTKDIERAKRIAQDWS